MRTRSGIALCAAARAAVQHEAALPAAGMRRLHAYGAPCDVRLEAALPAAGVRRQASWRLHAYGAPCDVRLEAARVPAVRAPDELLVRVSAAGLNPLDLAMIGGYGRVALNALRRVSAFGADGGGVEFPLVVGREFVGVVERAGLSARLRRGQRVWGVLPPHAPGALAQYVIVKDRWAGAAPQELGDASAGGALYAALTACAALRAGGVRPGEHAARPARVLVLGVGGVGHAALQLAAAGGARVTAGCSARRRPAALAAGAHEALDRHAADYGARLEEGEWDLVLDCAGLGGREAAARRWRFARYVTLTTPLLRDMDACGQAAGAANAALKLARQNAALAGRAAVGPGPLPPHVRWAFFSVRREDIELLRRLAERGRFQVDVERVFPWRELHAALERAAAGHANGKLIIDFNAQ